MIKTAFLVNSKKNPFLPAMMLNTQKSSEFHKTTTLHQILQTGGSLYISALIFIAFFWISSTCIAAPELQVDSAEFNWGTVYSGEKKEHNFILKNNGDEPLRITKIHNSCGCTAAIMDEKTILPLKQSTLSVHFNSSGFKGHVTKRVLVTSNDPLHPQKQFLLKANVIQELTVTPPQISIKNTYIHKNIAQKLSLRNQSNVPIHIKSIRSTSHRIVLNKIPAVLEPKETVNIELTIQVPEPITEPVNGYILIKAQGHTHNKLRIPIVIKQLKPS